MPKPFDLNQPLHQPWMVPYYPYLEGRCLSVGKCGRCVYAPVDLIRSYTNYAALFQYLTMFLFHQNLNTHKQWNVHFHSVNKVLFMSSYVFLLTRPFLFVSNPGLQTCRRGALRIPDDPVREDRGFRRALQTVLLSGRVLLQVWPGPAAAGLPLEQVLGQHP